MKFMDVQTAKGMVSMSKIVMGTDYFGVNIPEDTAFALMDKYIALGGNTIDTARVYGKAPAPDPDKAYANSEPIVGRWLKSRGCREKIFLVTKGAHPSMKDMNCRRLDRASIDSDIAMSLHELDTNYIDLYFLHRDDPSRPVEEIIDTLDVHVKAGRLHAIGASNWTVSRINAANAYAKAHGKTPFTASQIHWCAARVPQGFWDDPSIQVMDPEAYEGYTENKIPVMAFSSQARGYFSKLLAGESLPAKRMNRYDIPENRRRLESIRALCEETKAPASALMLAYVTSSQPVQGAAIIGCSQLGQLEETMSYADLSLTESQRAKMRGE